MTSDEMKARIAELEAENRKLKFFVDVVMDEWPSGYIDGLDLQDMAVNHGILMEVDGGFDPEEHVAPCGKHPPIGSPWFERTKLSLPTPPEAG